MVYRSYFQVYNKEPLKVTVVKSSAWGWFEDNYANLVFHLLDSSIFLLIWQSIDFWILLIDQILFIKSNNKIIRMEHRNNSYSLKLASPYAEAFRITKGGK